MITIDREELAWAAGFFDGEGSVGCHRNGKYRRVQASVSQTDVRPLERFQQALGGLGFIHANNLKKAPSHHKTKWQWQVQSFEETQAVMAMLWRFLSEPKKAQAIKAFKKMAEYHKSLPLSRGIRDYGSIAKKSWITRRERYGPTGRSESTVYQQMKAQP